jgi:glycosyltransferase involved in cell wall biosynthesis
LFALLTVTVLSLKLVYITLYPERYPRVKKIASSLKGEVTFQALVRKVRVRPRRRKAGRLISAFINYTSFLIQIFFTHADVYWVANAPDLFVLPLILRKKSYILDYRAPWPAEVMFEFGSGTLSRMAEYLTYIALKYAKAVTLASTLLLKDVEKFRKKVFIIPNYPQKDYFKPSISYDQFRKIQKIGKDTKVILFLGRLNKNEGFDIFADIVEKLLKTGKKISFWIVGDGVLRPIAEELERKFPTSVKFFGWRPYREIPNLINASDVGVVLRHKTFFSPYCNEEGVHKISEYMFFSKPIVACGIAPSKEYLLVERQDLVKGILEALEGRAPKPTPRTWEDDCKEKVLEVLDFVKKF